MANNKRTTGGALGTLDADNLIASTFPPAEVFTIDIKTPGIIARGTVMSLESDGKYEVLGAGSGTASCVLAEDAAEDDVIGVAYRTGHFYRNGLTVKDDYTLSATDENHLRLAGILLSDGI